MNIAIIRMGVDGSRFIIVRIVWLVQVYVELGRDLLSLLRICKSPWEN